MSQIVVLSRTRSSGKTHGLSNGFHNTTNVNVNDNNNNSSLQLTKTGYDRKQARRASSESLYLVIQDRETDSSRPTGSTRLFALELVFCLLTNPCYRRFIYIDRISMKPNQWRNLPSWPLHIDWPDDWPTFRRRKRKQANVGLQTDRLNLCETFSSAHSGRGLD